MARKRTVLNAQRKGERARIAYNTKQVRRSNPFHLATQAAEHGAWNNGYYYTWERVEMRKARDSSLTS